MNRINNAWSREKREHIRWLTELSDIGLPIGLGDLILCNLKTFWEGDALLRALMMSV